MEAAKRRMELAPQDKLLDSYMMFVSFQPEFTERVGLDNQQWLGLSSSVSSMNDKEMIEVSLSREHTTTSTVSYELVEHNGNHYFPSLVSEDEHEDMGIMVVRPMSSFKITDEIMVTWWQLIGIYIGAANVAFALSYAPLLFTEYVWKRLRGNRGA